MCPRSGFRPSRRRAAPLVLAAFIGAGCGSTGTEGSLESDAVEADPIALSVGEVTFEIRTREGDPDYEFGNLFSAQTLDDGSLLVTDFTTQEVRLFDSEGRARWTSGGRGDGPGDFQFIGWVGADDEELLVWDMRARRLSFLEISTGRFVRSVSYPDLPGFPRAAGRFSDGSLLVFAEEVTPPENPGGLLPAHARWMRVDAAGRVDTIVAFEGAPRVDTEGVIQQAPLTAQPAADVRGDSIWMMLPEDSGYRIIDRQASTTVIHGDGASRPLLTDDIRAAYRRQWLAGLEDPGRRRAMEGWLAHIDGMETYPGYDRMVVGVDRRVWLRRLRASSSAPTWDVFDNSGRLAARAVLPDRFQLTEARGDEVLGLWTDDLDLEHVRRYRLTQGPGRPVEGR